MGRKKTLIDDVNQAEKKPKRKGTKSRRRKNKRADGKEAVRLLTLMETDSKNWRKHFRELERKFPKQYGLRPGYVSILDDELYQ